MRPYALDLRERVAAAVNHQEGLQRQSKMMDRSCMLSQLPSRYPN